MRCTYEESMSNFLALALDQLDQPGRKLQCREEDNSAKIES